MSAGTYAVIPYSVLAADRPRAIAWIAASTAARWQDVAHPGERAVVLRWDPGNEPGDLPGDLVVDLAAWLAARTEPDEDDVRVQAREYRQGLGVESAPERYVVLTVAQAANLYDIVRPAWEHCEVAEAAGNLYLLVPVSGDLASIDGGWGLPAGLDVSGRQTRTVAYVESYLATYDGPTRRAWRQAFVVAVREAML